MKRRAKVPMMMMKKSQHRKSEKRWRKKNFEILKLCQKVSKKTKKKIFSLFRKVIFEVHQTHTLLRKKEKF